MGSDEALNTAVKQNGAAAHFDTTCSSMIYYCTVRLLYTQNLA
jgi:hypothetical protein